VYSLLGFRVIDAHNGAKHSSPQSFRGRAQLTFRPESPHIIDEGLVALTLRRCLQADHPDLKGSRDLRPALGEHVAAK
jgi:hypothetical protein